VPFIRIYGIPPERKLDEVEVEIANASALFSMIPIQEIERAKQSGILAELVIAIQTRLESSKDEFKISKGATTVFFPPDLLATGLGEEIIVDLGLREKEGRTDGVIAATANAIVQIIREFFPTVPLIECFPNIIPRAHFAQSKL